MLALGALLRYWRVEVNDGDLQLALLAFVDPMACAVELYCNWPAAVLLHWGTVDSQGATWKRMELNKMLTDVGKSSRGERGDEEKQQKKPVGTEENGSSTDEADSASIEASQATEKSGNQHLETVYGTFAHYAVDDKASQTVFEVGTRSTPFPPSHLLRSRSAPQRVSSGLLGCVFDVLSFVS